MLQEPSLSCTLVNSLKVSKSIAETQLRIAQANLETSKSNGRLMDQQGDKLETQLRLAEVTLDTERLKLEREKQALANTDGDSTKKMQAELHEMREALANAKKEAEVWKKHYMVRIRDFFCMFIFSATINRRSSKRTNQENQTLFVHCVFLWHWSLLCVLSIAREPLRFFCVIETQTFLHRFLYSLTQTLRCSYSFKPIRPTCNTLVSLMVIVFVTLNWKLLYQNGSHSDRQQPRAGIIRHKFVEEGRQ